MSLINDALKKAQREREQAAGHNGPPGNTQPPLSPGGGGGRPRSVIWLLLLVVAVAGGTAYLTLHLARSDKQDAPDTGEKQAPDQIANAASPVPAIPTPVPTANPSPITTSPVPTVAPTPAPTIAPPTLSPDAERGRRQALVDKVRVSGIRISERGNRALVNDRLVRVGDSLEGLGGMRVKEIEADHLTFEDDLGVYVRRL